MILIDIGCFNGDSVLHFTAYRELSEIRAYDPVSNFLGIWTAIEERYPHVKFYNEAVYTYNGVVEYTQRPDDRPLGSTVMQNKVDWGMGKIRQVKCVDILDIVPDEKYWLKIDGEGSEYDIVERLIENNKTNNIDLLFIEFHTSKLSGGGYEERQKKIEEHFSDRVRKW